MQELYFLITLLAIIILIIIIFLKLLRGKAINKALSILSLFIISYSLLWAIFYIKTEIQPVNFGEDICFDDWCATITSFEKLTKIDRQTAVGQFYVLSVRMTNKARGIAQKPSEPRIHILDENGQTWSISTIGQKALEASEGFQIPIDERLALHQSLQTKIVFDIPKDAKGLKAIIEEGPPFITNLLLQNNKKVFLLK